MKKKTGTMIREKAKRSEQAASKPLGDDAGPGGKTGVEDLRRNPPIHAGARNEVAADAGPSYEAGQWPEPTPGGSTDPHNTLSESDSGDLSTE